ncbi:MAG: hypothetical protein AB7H77_03675 [Bdellovibrionales bacterium]
MRRKIIQEVGALFDRRMPLAGAIAAVILLQSFTAMWWAAAQEAETRFHDRRLAEVEAAAMRHAERLARIEARLR